jgi:hypothetical protein
VIRGKSFVPPDFGNITSGWNFENYSHQPVTCLRRQRDHHLNRKKFAKKKSSFPGSVIKITFETAVVGLVFSMMVKIHSSFHTLP